MILCFEFEYSNLNDNLAFFLDFYAKSSGLEYSIQREDYILRLYVKGKQDELLKFSDEISIRVPHSIFLQGSKVFVSEEMNGGLINFKNTLPNITPGVVDKFHNEKISACENGILSGMKVEVKGAFVSVEESNFNELLDFVCDEILNNNPIKFKNFQGTFEVSKFHELSEEFDILMVTNLKNLPKIFISNKNEQIALASYEKPVVELKTNAIYRQNHPDSPRFFKVVAPNDIFMYALCEKLLKNGLNFLAVKTNEPQFMAVVLENSYIFSNAQIYYKDKIKKEINHSKDRDLTNFNLINEFKNENRLRVFLSKTKDDEIKIFRKNDSFDVLRLPTPSSFEELFDEISKEEGGDRLVANYASSFNIPTGKIEAKSSFFTLFCIVGKILGFDEDFKTAGKKLLENAMDFNGAKGPRLDFKMANRSEFNIIKFIRSGMSFRLAGVDDKILSFGYIESFAHFLSDFCDTLKEDFSVSVVVLQGSLFEYKTLSNLVLKHVGVGINTKFSKELSLEEMF
ncbi:hypothetical protein [Campylobacter sp. RM16192]|uniref:hypothetical protein n=1 Tax=Campylobacter sp. RM16192 TaxID=1660080 RepID=UPI00145237CD|nr:hypothetical protein [Campylobacter sp. RM16192]QCD52622.1 hypothetical protein CDOMC_1001 [Campylobacter sp. RM16192]